MKPMGIVSGCFGLALAGFVLAPCVARAAAIPFTSASVTSTDGQHYAIAWAAPGVRHVKVFAGTDPSQFDTDRLVAQGGGSGMARVADLPAAARWYFEVVPDHGAPLVVADRSLHLASAGNFRDAGGYRTADGKWVRMGVVYRSNGLEHMSPADLGEVSGLGLKLVCDLRTDAERQHGPDIVPPGVADVQASVLEDDTAKLAALMQTPAPGASQPDPNEVAHGIYRDFVSLPSALASYHIMFERLANPAQLPTVFHCTAGKDRTGWGAAVLLTLLGVPHKTVLSDYVLTDKYLQQADMQHIREKFGPNSVVGRLALTADPGDLEASFAEVKAKYGSFDRYLHDGLKLDDATIAALKRNFLAG